MITPIPPPEKTQEQSPSHDEQGGPHTPEPSSLSYDVDSIDNSADEKGRDSRQSNKNQSFDPKETERPYKVLERAIASKQEDVRENRTGLNTNVVTYIPPTTGLIYGVFAALAGAGSPPVIAGIMLCLAAPGFMSLLSEVRSDEKDLSVLKRLRDSYDRSGDAFILHDSKLIVRIKGSHLDQIDFDEAMDNMDTLRIQYEKASERLQLEMSRSADPGPAAREQDNNHRKALAKRVDGLQNSLKDIGQQALKVCVTDLPATLRHLKDGFKDLVSLTRKGEMRKLLRNSFERTGFERLMDFHKEAKAIKANPSKANVEVPDILSTETNESEIPQRVLNTAYAKRLVNVHKVQANLRDIARQRLVTATGLGLDTAFMSTAFIAAGLQAASGDYLGAGITAVFSGALSLVPVRVLAERKHDLATKNEAYGIEYMQEGYNFYSQAFGEVESKPAPVEP